MKPFFISLMVLIFNITYAQNNVAEHKPLKEKKRKFTKFFLQINYNIVVGSFGDNFKTNPNLEAEEDLRNNINGSNGGMNADNGYGMDAGCFFYFKKSENKKIKSGIKTSFISYSSFTYRWQIDTGDYIFNDASYKSIKLYGFKVGPFLETRKNNLTFLFAYQLAPAFASKGSWSYNDAYSEVDGNVRYGYTDKASFKLNKGFGLKHELMLQIGYKQFYGELACSLGNVSFNNIEFERRLYEQIETYNTFTQSWTYYVSNSFIKNVSFKSKMPMAFLSVNGAWVF